MKNFYRLIQGDNRQVLPTIGDNSIDVIVTDPQYGINFMGKNWDKALPDKKSFQECFRVLKPGALAFVMSSPRQDVLWRMMALLESTGFELRQSPIYWAYASGFPKAYDVSKGIDKKLGFKRTKSMEIEPFGRENRNASIRGFGAGEYEGGLLESSKQTITQPESKEAKRWDGWKSQTGLKPAVEVILMVNKPRSEKTIVDNVLVHGTGAMNVDACRIPFDSKQDFESTIPFGLRRNPVQRKDYGKYESDNGRGYDKNSPSTPQKGRFPANLLVSDGVLDTGKTSGGGYRANPSTKRDQHENIVYGKYQDTYTVGERGYPDEGSFSRYFSLDAWWLSRISKLPIEVRRTMPFLVVPKASKSERDEGLEYFPLKNQRYQNGRSHSHEIFEMEGSGRKTKTKNRNTHPTIKPLKLKSYLVELGCPVGGVVLDPFVGQGTTLVASYLMGKSCIGIDINEEYCGITDAKARHYMRQRSLDREVEYSFEGCVL